MKKLSYAFVLALLCIVGTSMKPHEEVKWMTFNEGYKLAKKSGKIMLVDVYTDWCGWCKRMDRDTYAKANIAGLISSDYVAIKFNPEAPGEYEFKGKKYSGPELAQVISNNQIGGYPTTVFYYPKAEKTNVVGGYYDASRFEGVLVKIKNDFKGAK